MTRISQYDQILLQLKSQLEKAERVSKSRPATRASKTVNQKRSQIDRLSSVLKDSDLTEQEQHRALVSALLAQAFGEGVDSDPSMQSIVSEVTRQMRENEDSRAMLDKSLSELKAGKP
ncbi:hypothetical protein [Ponticaulis sp.]|uniref:hypothetical protein n=1 Tax=Ponticaulis sp. TaxID=2020902 RepID=UPI000B6553E6|nr:hypothetical protein [Ponticaulis sp.]MAJ07458.1 hypothetical protein [Ponticaulis sp.]RPG17693.1 MAG: hypothetical protein CBC85_003885 [Hyphomonadaceae bacterium TMED125]HBH89582.1 hypothetical protein [Hyphomonadaceae bacterium]HBJ93917.1 hypothetical protein [Hyphomonadaceae bacterium]|tara:strand:- start:10061 stop:10414 length:354 start_codon:yes stop_codon:yes gene_type:complete